MITQIFEMCVSLLYTLADWFHTDYETINVVIFCMLWPLITLILAGICVYQRTVIRRYEQAEVDSVYSPDTEQYKYSGGMPTHDE